MMVVLPTMEEIEGLEGAAVHHALFEVERASRQVESVRAALIARGEEQGYHTRELGLTSVQRWVAANAGTWRSVANQHVLVARAVANLPFLAKALADGEIGVEQARMLARAYANPRVRDALVETDAEMTGFAVTLPDPPLQDRARPVPDGSGP